MTDAEEPAAGTGEEGSGVDAGDETQDMGSYDGQASTTDDGQESGRPNVPEDAEAAVADDDHALPLSDLQYPEFSFESGGVDDDGGFDLARDLDREEMQAWLEDLAGGLGSHDVGVESADGRVVLGVAPDGVEMSFDPDEDHVGEFAVSFSMRAKAMTVQDADDEKVGARGGKGFVPLAMLEEGADPSEFRCYNWIEDPGRE